MTDAPQNPFQSPAACATTIVPLNPWLLASPLLSLPSCFLSLCLLAWIHAQPASTFHDQGGMLITLVLFPVALLGWAVCGLPASIIGIVMLVRLRHDRVTTSRILVPLCGLLLGVLSGFLALVVLIAG